MNYDPRTAVPYPAPDPHAPEVPAPISIPGPAAKRGNTGLLVSLASLALATAALVVALMHFTGDKPPTPEQMYLDRLSSVGIEVKDRDIALNDARTVCRIFTDMGSFLDAARFVKSNNPALDEVGAAYVVVTANQSICPEHGPFQRGT
jgi:hypothetical protein